MKIKEFVERYENMATEKLQNDFIRDNLHITKYVPYIDKVQLAMNIVFATSIDKETGNVKINTPARYLMYVRVIIEKYTDLEIEDKGFYDEYDLLNKSGSLEKIIERIPENELAEFKTVLDMTKDDFVTNKYETKSFISEQCSKLKVLFSDSVEPAMNKLTEAINSLDESKIEKIENMINKVLK